MQFNPASINECPSCKSIISFTGTSANGIVCRVCGTTLYHQSGQGLTEIAIQTSFPKTDYIQPGTTGTWNNQSFTVLGRFRAFFDKAAFNYWTIEWQNKQVAYLAEGYGLYSILQPAAEPVNISSAVLQKLKPGSLADLRARMDFLVEKKQPVLELEAEGEFFLPLMLKRFTILECAAKNGTRITLFDFDNDRIFAWEQEVVNPDQLNLAGTRDAPAGVKTYTCEHCHKPITVKTFPYAQSCACTECGDFYRIHTHGGLKHLKASPVQEAPVLLPGSTGLLQGNTYEVLGFTQKEEKNIYKSRWREYTLYNPRTGYAYLSEYDGHWIFLKECADSPVLLHQKEKVFTFKKREFLLFNTYKYNVVSARGEFPYHVFDNGETNCSEYIHPPEIWIQEIDRKEGIRWFNGHHIPPGEIKKAFSATYIPLRVGVGALQPGSLNNYQVFRGSFIAVLLLLLFHVLTNMGKKEQVLFDQFYNFPDSVNTLQIVTPHYELDKRRSNLRFDITADVSNSWFELNATLVNTKTGKQYSMEKGVEYYYGYSGGESWTEGSNREVAYFTRVPSGTYFLEMAGIREGGVNRASHFSIKITYDVPSMRNLWIVLIIFLAWPLVKLVMIHYTETARWRHSPYAEDHKFIQDED